MEVKGNSDFIWKDPYFQELKEELLHGPLVMAQLFHCRGTKILQAMRLPKNRTEASRRKLLTAITLWLWRPRGLLCIQMCVPV